MFESGVSIQRSQVLNFAAMQAQSVLQTAAVVLSKNIPEESRPPPHLKNCSKAVLAFICTA
jgi:hypothetical protein